MKGSLFPALVLVLLVQGLSISKAAIPKTPEPGEFLHDYARLLSSNEADQIRQTQKQIFVQFNVPIVVVTIDRMVQYISPPPPISIEQFASVWFSTWGIGDERTNKGMLIIVSEGDRKARIELGKSWGRRWDGYCAHVMNNLMVPNFKSGDYGTGILKGVEALARAAEAGPDSDPPQPGLFEQFETHPIVEFVTQENPLGPNVINILLLAGVLCLLGAVFFPEHRSLLLKIGIGCILTALVFWVVLLIAAVSLRSKRGGFGGGSSGGGGATGSW